MCADIPTWALVLLTPAEADRYARESAAHLYERIEDGELRAARVDRRRLIRYALILALTLRIRRAIRKAR